MCALSVLLLLLLIEWKLSYQGDESTTNAPLLLPFRTILYRLYKVLGGRKPISFFPSIIFFCRRIHFLFVAIQHMFQYYQAFIYLVKKPYNWIADGKFFRENEVKSKSITFTSTVLRFMENLATGVGDSYFAVIRPTPKSDKAKSLQ